MTVIALISDTHITLKHGKLSENVLKAFEGADIIVHAGDITQTKVLNEFESVAPVIAVFGNNDKLDLNETEVFEVGKFKIAVNHATKLSADFEKLHDFALNLEEDILITDHTHTPYFKIIDGILLVNPGSANRPVKSEASVVVLKIVDECDAVEDIEVEFITLCD